MLLGETDAARPMVEKVLATGEKVADFMDLCRQHGLSP
jgi:hypothetical protein